ncbi:MAG TPA: Gfo/Idh/MocA family oxidoreductase [Motilibacterales bacterium]|nr:Gfo/Idh/MocA family oxidoreductase [Motilibacterales bacterium]
MDTVRFAVIGTSWITGALIDAGRTVDGFEVVAVCSRSAGTGQQFADRYGIERLHASVADLASDPDVDAVYIASPNSLHAEQSIAMLRSGKHVLTEKPLGANAAEIEAMAVAADDSGRVLMEAYTSPWEPNVQAIRDALPEVGRLRRVVLAKDQYSSRYDKLKSGELPNAFNPAFAAGSLMDLGIYAVALAQLLFGEPTSVHATGHLLPSGVDGQGTVLLGYDGFEVACLHSKIAPGGIGSAITGEQGVMHFDDCSVPTSVRLDRRDGTSRDLTREQSPLHMRYEVEHFLACTRSGQQSPTWPPAKSLAVARILDQARAQVGVRFPTDG